MPFARHGASLIFYAHVPKCAGSSVETYLARRFGPLAMVDTRYMSRPVGKRWSNTSPQHIHVEALNQLFPKEFLDHSFAVVRHPEARIVSAYKFQRDVERTIPQTTSFSDWLADLAEELAEHPFAHDNHVRPMDQMVPEGAEIFHLEYGLEAIIPWLDEICGDTDGPRSMPRVNEAKPVKSAKVEPTPTDRALIAEIYAADYARFGYTPDAKAPTAPKPTRSMAHVIDHADDPTWKVGAMSRLKTKLARVLK